MRRIVIFFLLINFNVLSYGEELSITLSSSIDMQLYTKFPSYKTVDNYPFYEFGEKSDDRILLQRARDFYENANLEFKEIMSYDEFYQVFDKWIKRADVIKKVSSYLVDAHTLDIKTVIYEAWDKLIISDLKKEFKENGLSDSGIEILDLIMKNNIDIVLEGYKVDTTIIGNVLTKTAAESITTKMFESATKKIGLLFAWWEAALKTANLVNAVVGVVSISDNRVKQIFYSLQYLFIHDYVFKYNSNIDEMKKKLEPYAKNKKINEFMDLWLAYIHKSGKEGELIFNAISSSINPFSEISLGNLSKYNRKSAEDVLDYINRYSRNGLFSTKLTLKYVKLENSNKYLLQYTWNDTNSNKKLLVLPKSENIDKFGEFSIVKIDTTLDIGEDRRETVNYYFNDTSLEDYTKKRFVNSVRVNFKVNLQNNKKETIETLSYKTGLFFIPSYLVDVPPTFWANKYFATLFNSGAMRGNKLGFFNYENKITIGELLKVSSKYLIDNENQMNLLDDYVNGIKIPFAKYAKYLKKQGVYVGIKGKHIDPNYSELTYNATLGYASRVFNNMMGEHFTNCGDSDLKGWDLCSKPLKDKCIISGDNGYFKVDKLITRAEFSKMLVRTKHFLDGENLCNANKLSKGEEN